MQLTVLAQPFVNVTKSGNKLGLHIPNLSVTNETSRVVRITIQSDSGTASFLAKASEWICIPSRIRSTLGIKDGQGVRVLELQTIQPHSPRPLAIVGNKVDMLSLVPATTSRGNRLYVDSYEDEEPRLRIWYYHLRGAAHQIDLKRYVNIRILGGLLGQLQAEGEKKDTIVSFKNTSIAEHADFILGLRELGLQTDSICGRCVFNSDKTSLERAREFAGAYNKLTGVLISKFDDITTMKGAIAADTLVRSTVFATIVASSMRRVRKGIVGNDSIREAFLAKLLTGDGSLDSRVTKRLDVRVKIVDNDRECLSDYAKILEREGFKPKVLAKHRTVRSYCTWQNLLTLYRIGAFRNSRSWIKLLCSIQIAAKGRENKGYARLLDLAELGRFTSRDVSVRYDVCMRSANLWIRAMIRRNLVRAEEIDGNRYIRYVLGEHGEHIVRVLRAARNDFDEISFQKKCGTPELILEQSKIKKIG